MTIYACYKTFEAPHKLHVVACNLLNHSDDGFDVAGSTLVTCYKVYDDDHVELKIELRAISEQQNQEKNEKPRYRNHRKRRWEITHK